MCVHVDVFACTHGGAYGCFSSDIEMLVYRLNVGLNPVKSSHTVI